MSKPFANYLLNASKSECLGWSAGGPEIQNNYDTIFVKGDIQNSTEMPVGSEIMLRIEQLLLLPGQ